MSNVREGFITSRSYRNAQCGAPSARSIRDCELVAKVLQIHGENYGVYGVRKMWHALSRRGVRVGREQTARLMRLAVVSGKGKGRSPITTHKARRGRHQIKFGSSRVSRRWSESAMGRRYYLCSNRSRVRLCGVCDGRVLSQDRGLGTLRFHADRGITVAGVESGDHEREGNGRGDTSLRPRITVCVDCV